MSAPPTTQISLGDMYRLWQAEEAAQETGTLVARPAPRVGMVSAATVTPERITWIWPSHIPCAKPVLVDGPPGLGKTTFTLDIAARVSTGRAMPDGSTGDFGRPRGVLILTAEDGTADTLVPRLIAAGADLERVWILEGIPDTDEQGEVVTDDDGNAILRPAVVPGDSGFLAFLCREYDIAMVVFDPFVAFVDGSLDTYKDHHVRRATAALKTLGEKTGTAVLMVRHHVKNAADRTAKNAGGGSVAFIGAGRAGLQVVADGEDPTLRYVSVTKMNVGMEGGTWSYRIEGVEIDGGIETSRIVWQGCDPRDADTLLKMSEPSRERGRPSVEREEAEEFVRTRLAGGAISSVELAEEAKELGISKRTLDRARKACGVQAIKNASGGWTVMIPTIAQDAS